MNFGSDLSCFDDITPNLAFTSEQTALAQAIGRRLITPRGSLWEDQDYGTDVRQWLQAPSPTAARIAAAVETEVLKEPRVESVTAAVTWTEATRQLRIDLAMVASDETEFSLTVLVDNLTVQLLEENT